MKQDLHPLLLITKSNVKKLSKEVGEDLTPYIDTTYIPDPRDPIQKDPTTLHKRVVTALQIIHGRICPITVIAYTPLSRQPISPYVYCTEEEFELKFT